MATRRNTFTIALSQTASETALSTGLSPANGIAWNVREIQLSFNAVFPGDLTSTGSGGLAISGSQSSQGAVVQYANDRDSRFILQQAFITNSATVGQANFQLPLKFIPPDDGLVVVSDILYVQQQLSKMASVSGSLTFFWDPIRLTEVEFYRLRDGAL